MQLRIFRYFALAIASLLLCGPVFAQVTTATLVGQLRDSSGAGIPGAMVVATHEGTGVAREARTDGNGEFVLSALPNGPYTVKIELTGFKTLLHVLREPNFNLAFGIRHRAMELRLEPRARKDE